MNKGALLIVNKVEKICLRHLSDLIEETLKSASNRPLSDIAAKNKLALFSSPHAKQTPRSSEEVAFLKKKNCIVFFLLHITCQARQTNLASFFEHENQACPPSFSDMGQLRQGSKSYLMEC